MKNSVIVIGAGATGLLVAKTLSKAGKKVTVLEAHNRLGGRIHTLNSGSETKTELGAEFIHGDLHVTLGLFKEANIAAQKFTPQMWRYSNGKFRQEDEQLSDWDEVIKELNQLQEDMPVAEFMQTYFGGEKYGEISESVLQFVAGYDTADPAKASAFALRKEWQSEDENAQHHIPAGYVAMINYLANQCIENGGAINLNCLVRHINWQQGEVTIVTANGDEYKAEKIVIALPLGVLQADAITFYPPLPLHTKAFANIGFGSIIKVLLQFDTPFWENDVYGGIKAPSYLFSNEKIPTWWTQGQGNSLFTGWLGGNAALELKEATDDELLAFSLQSLANLFKIDADTLRNKLIISYIANWTADPLAYGSYAYDMVGSNKARQLLNQPVENTLYFAGEYLYDGPAMGTVEAALNSGLKTAGRVSLT